VHAHAEVIPIADVYRRKQGINAMNILLAEDNPVNQEVIGEILRRAGHQVQIAKDGEKALDALASDKEFDMVLLDMNMPEVSGLDVLKQFRFMDTSAKTPVVMLSADALPETMRACKEAGANDYLTKPVNLEELLETLARFAQAQENSSGEEQHPPVSFEDTDGVLDTRQLDEFAWMSESSEKIAKFISLYESSGHEHLSTMNSAATEDDRTTFLNEEHAFKGAAATMGAIKVTALCREIENHKASLCQHDMLSYRKKLQSAFQQSLKSLHTYLKTLDTSKT
jgi:two-component system sensor histidine kinase RpfC